jgi:2-polyprenyl-3-methyl-5-hydroxy-6-metoxy-1,4-benzoquinol methylase
MRWAYNMMYRTGLVPFDTRNPTRALKALVESGRLEPCRALELACGAGKDAIFLAKHGFDVTAVDFADAAIGLA